MPPPRRWLTRRRLALATAALLAVLCAWLGASFAVATRLTRRASPPFPEPLPALAPGPGEELRLPTADGEELGAWYFPGPGPGASVLVLHGNGQSRSACAPLAKFLLAEGHAVLALSLRAHGDSTGQRNDLGYSARHDVLAAVSYLERRRPGRPVVVQGTSLGAAAAIYAAAALGTRVGGYILESPYRDIRTAVRNRTDAYLYPPFNRAASLGLELVGPLVLPDMDRMSPVERVADIPRGVPLLLLAGRRDDRARPAEVEAIRARAAGPCRLVIFEEAGHELFCVRCPERYQEEVRRFLGAFAGR